LLLSLRVEWSVGRGGSIASVGAHARACVCVCVSQG
jgi:hypothetical protein